MLSWKARGCALEQRVRKNSYTSAVDIYLWIVVKVHSLARSSCSCIYRFESDTCMFQSENWHCMKKVSKIKVWLLQYAVFRNRHVAVAKVAFLCLMPYGLERFKVKYITLFAKIMNVFLLKRWRNNNFFKVCNCRECAPSKKLLNIILYS